ncbi:unnamed protein product [Hymenolepis diminuta]|uniref:Uncharacterized protein n=1 Tax=Hymenolepis diminuta TaxID=6216 RepID=A0A564YML8_HYMDI|nr:unnamed protein product [Hymenolepis diminuta]
MTDDSVNSADDNFNQLKKIFPLFTKSLEEDLHYRNTYPGISEKLCNAQISSPPFSQVNSWSRRSGSVEENSMPNQEQSTYEFCMNNNYDYFQNQCPSFKNEDDDWNQLKIHQQNEWSPPLKRHKHFAQWQNDSFEALYHSKKHFETEDKLNGSKIIGLTLGQLNGWTQRQKIGGQELDIHHSHSKSFNTDDQNNSSGRNIFSNKGITFGKHKSHNEQLPLEGCDYQESHCSFGQSEDEQTNAFNDNYLQHHYPFTDNQSAIYNQGLMESQTIPRCLWNFGREKAGNAGEESNALDHINLQNQDSNTRQQRDKEGQSVNFGRTLDFEWTEGLQKFPTLCQLLDEDGNLLREE